MVSPKIGRTLVRFLLLAALLLPGISPATVVLYRISDDEILVGADSFFEVDGIEQPPKAVKIHQAGPEFFAIQGKSRVGETRLIELVTQARRGPEEGIDTALFALRYREALIQWLAEAGRIRPDLARPYGTNGIVVTAFQLFGFRRGRPFMEALEFVSERFGTSVAIRRQLMNFEKGKSIWIPAGTWTQGNPAQDFIATNNPVVRMRYLFEREFRASPPQGSAKLARPPLDILRISASGAKWVQRKLECPEISPYGRAEPTAISQR